MKNLIFYQLEVSICLTGFYLAYLLLFRRETNFRFRRFYLLSSSLLSFILPALDIRFSVQSQEIPMDYLNLIPYYIGRSTTVNAPSGISTESAIAFIWGAGLLFMLVRLAISMHNVRKIVSRASQHTAENIRVSNDEVPPFSFFSTIILSRRNNQSEAAKYILAHEQAHTKQHHSVDVLFYEILKSVQWFNPIAWLAAAAAVQNLEYLADQTAVNTTENPKAYQMALVEYARNSGRKILRTEFSKSNLKNRIIMMNHPNNKKISAWKIMMLLPVLSTMMMSFSIKIENLDMKKEVTELIPVLNQSVRPMLPADHSTLSRSDEDSVYKIADNIPQPVCGMSEYFKEINKILKYPESAVKQGIEGKVFVEFIVRKNGDISDIKVLKGISQDCDKAAVTAVEEGPGWIPGTDKGKKVSVRLVMPIQFKLGKPTQDNAEGKAGSESPGLKSSTETSTSKVQSETESLQTDKDTTSDFAVNMTGDDINMPLILLDGNEVSKEELAGLNPESFDKINVIKGRQAVEAYGTKGKNGVIEIASNKGANKESTLTVPAYTDVTIRGNPNDDAFKIRTNGLMKLDQQNPPLVFKDGVEITLDIMEKINPHNVKSIEVLKDESALKLYGDKGKNGVILITSDD